MTSHGKDREPSSRDPAASSHFQSITNVGERLALAVEHYDERQLAALVIATTNFFNRVNGATRQPAPQSWG